MNKVNFYYDGFNLYFGLRSKYDRKYLWLDLNHLSNLMLKNGQQISKIKYFSARLTKPPSKVKRQTNYIEALESLEVIEIFYGQYLTHEHICPKCNHKEIIPTEKMTDVNIATELLVDGFNNEFDVAIIISADSDLVGPIKQLKNLFPQKKIVIAFPPDRDSFELRKNANAYFRIGKQKFQQSQFPNPVISLKGYPLYKPESWN